MQGAVEWPQLIAIAGGIVGVTLAVSGFACWLLWKAWETLNQLRTAVTTEIATTKTALETRLNGIDTRLHKVEAENLLGMATRQDFHEFRRAVEVKLDQLRAERHRDMQGLHSRLNDILMLPRMPPVSADDPPAE